MTVRSAAEPFGSDAPAGGAWGVSPAADRLLGGGWKPLASRHQ
ncbi:MAG: hypothetical protein AAF652_17980 [Cyanobacteria bacterium P01_C01_bin.72]